MSGDVLFSCRTDKPALLYKVGETMRFSLSYPESCYGIKYTCNTDGGEEFSGFVKGNFCAVKASVSMPGFAYIHAEATDEEGKCLPSCHPFDGGAGAEPRKIRAATETPYNLEAFYSEMLGALDSVKPEIIEKKRLFIPGKEGFDIFDMKIACPGGAPVSGILTVPKGKSSLPVTVGYKGYGVVSAPADTDNDKIIFFINAHGIENLREPEYYSALASSSLKSYGMSKEENARPETSYFYGMAMRAIQAARFAAGLYEYDGEKLSVWGGSQGAFQAMTAAINCASVKRACIFVPWMCDINGKALKRYRIASPQFSPGLAYYDLAVQARRARENLIITDIEAGLGDESCQSSGICAMYNSLSCKKSMYFLQGRTHQFIPPDAEKFVY